MRGGASLFASVDLLLVVEPTSGWFDRMDFARLYSSTVGWSCGRVLEGLVYRMSWFDGRDLPRAQCSLGNPSEARRGSEMVPDWDTLPPCSSLSLGEFRV